MGWGKNGNMSLSFKQVVYCFMDKIFFILIFLINATANAQIMGNVKYKELTYTEARMLSKSNDAVFLRTLECNNAHVFAVNDSFLIVPINPFANALIVYDRSAFEDMIKTNNFPVTEKLNAFYDRHANTIENLDLYASQLIIELQDYLKKNEFDDGQNGEDVDSVYQFLKTKKTLSKYKLNFILLLAKKLIKDTNARWKIGLLKEKMSLRPIVSIVLVKQEDSVTQYFNVEDRIFGRRGFFCFKSLKSDAEQFQLNVDQIAVIDKVFNWPFKP